jgi:ATP-dependent Lon protease
VSDETDSKPLTADPEIPDELALVPIRDLVVFPYMIVALRVSRPVSIEAVTRTLETDERLCFLASQRDAREDQPGPGSFYRMGTIGTIMRMRKLTEGGLKIVVQGLCRATIEGFIAQQPSFNVRINRQDDASWVRSAEVDALLVSVRRDVDKLAELGKSLQPELSMVLQSVEDPGRMADLVSANLTLNVGEAQELLEVLDPVARLRHDEAPQPWEAPAPVPAVAPAAVPAAALAR